MICVEFIYFPQFASVLRGSFWTRSPVAASTPMVWIHQAPIKPYGFKPYLLLEPKFAVSAVGLFTLGVNAVGSYQR